MLPLVLLVVCFLFGPMMILYGLYFSFKDQAFYNRYVNNGITVQGTVVARRTRGTQWQVDIHYTDPQFLGKEYQLITSSPSASDLLTGDTAQLTLLSGYPGSAILDVPNISIRRWGMLMLGFLLPFTLIFFGLLFGRLLAVVLLRIALKELHVIPLPKMLVIVAVQFGVAFLVDSIWWQIATESILERNACEIGDQDEDIEHLSHTYLYSFLDNSIDVFLAMWPLLTSIKNPFLAETTCIAVWMASTSLLQFKGLLLGPLCCIWHALCFSTQDQKLYQLYLNEGEPTIGVVSSYHPRNGQLTVQYKYSGKNYKIVEVAEYQHFQIGEEIRVKVLQGHPKSGKVVKCLLEELNSFCCKRLSNFLLGCFGFLLWTVLVSVFTWLFARSDSVVPLISIGVTIQFIASFIVTVANRKIWCDEMKNRAIAIDNEECIVGAWRTALTILSE